MNADPVLVRDGQILRGEDIIRYHRAHMTASYHCIRCGHEMPSGNYPCGHCKLTQEELTKSIRWNTWLLDKLNRIDRTVKPKKVKRHVAIPPAAYPYGMLKRRQKKLLQARHAAVA